MDEVTATQAASLSGVSERTIRRRIAAGQLPARRIAPNRFAIRVQDLPIHHGFGDLALRLEALERRIAALELRQQIMTHAGAEVPVEPAAVAATPDGDVSLGQLHTLLAELARETERLAPLLGAGSTGGEDTGTGGHQNLRPVHPPRGRRA